MKIKYYRHLDLEREARALARQSKTLRIAEGYVTFGEEQVLGCLIAHIKRSDIRSIRNIQKELERGVAKYEALQRVKVGGNTARNYSQLVLEEFLRYGVPRCFYDRDKKTIAFREALMHQFKDRVHMAAIGYVHEMRYAEEAQTSVVESLGSEDQKQLEQILRREGFGVRITFPTSASFLFS